MPSLDVAPWTQSRLNSACEPNKGSPNIRAPYDRVLYRGVDDDQPRGTRDRPTMYRPN